MTGVQTCALPIFITGLTRGTTRGHLARACLEGIALQNCDIVQAMKRDSKRDLTMFRVDGGAAANDLLMQLQADLLGVPVVRPRSVETTALGAAYLAGLAVGVWPDQEAVRSHWRIDRRFEPALGADEREARYAEWWRAVERAKGWIE